MALNKDNWDGKRVLVTGADGFVGSHLTERLLSLGAKVSVFVRGTSHSGTTKYTFQNIRHIQDKLAEIITGDIGSSDTISLIKKNKPETIFHLAAEAYVPRSFDQPLEITQTNLIGTLHVLHAAMGIENIERVVCTSSSEIYGTPNYVPIDEDHPLNPAHPYGASKVAADRYAFAYYNTYQLPISIIRPFNMYGPRHTYDVLPKFIKLALENKPLTVHGDGKQTRDFLYVDDAVNAFLIMGQDKKAIGQAVNFGTGKETTIKELAEKIKKLSNSKSEIVYTKERTAQVKRLCCDFSKALKLFGWSPKVTLDEGLKINIEWERKNMRI
ncbi:MAG: GDP-mannose 4,6-dehydratase [Candidatus Aenigmarchaeota archaeon]|nr:GDP-mannose 4,6-dehydratase [Candidatus Aenigmarchaeota archaeon]